MATDLDRIDALLADQEKAVRDAFRRFIADVKSDTVMDIIADKLERGDIEGAQQIVDSYVIRMSAVIPSVNATVGTFTAIELGELIRETLPEVVSAVSFNPSWPRAAQIVESHRSDLVDYFIKQQRATTAQAIARATREASIASNTIAGAYRDGGHIRSAARAFRDSIGLTTDQEAWVENYRRKLELNSRSALQNALRNRNFDGRVEQAIENNRPLTPRQIDIMVDRFRSNALQMRAETIGRTEGIRAASEARDESVAQMLEQTGIDKDRWEETWNATRDKRTRDWHKSMDGQVRAVGVPFEDGLGNLLRYPSDPKAPANTRIACRCIKTYGVRPSA